MAKQLPKAQTGDLSDRPVTTKMIALIGLDRDQNLQARTGTDLATIRDYTERWRSENEAMARQAPGNSVFPPIEALYDGKNYFVYDGWHRIEAKWRALKAQGRGGKLRETIWCRVREGSREEAKLMAAAANRTHGLRRTAADKRRSVMLAINNPQAKRWSDRRIAEWCGVSHPFVAQLRAENDARDRPTKRETAAGRTVDTAAIGDANRRRRKSIDQSSPPTASGGDRAESAPWTNPDQTPPNSAAPARAPIACENPDPENRRIAVSLFLDALDDAKPPTAEVMATLLICVGYPHDPTSGFASARSMELRYVPIDRGRSGPRAALWECLQDRIETVVRDEFAAHGLAAAWDVCAWIGGFLAIDTGKLAKTAEANGKAIAAKATNQIPPAQELRP